MAYAYGKGIVPLAMASDELYQLLYKGVAGVDFPRPIRLTQGGKLVYASMIMTVQGFGARMISEGGTIPTGLNPTVDYPYWTAQNRFDITKKLTDDALMFGDMKNFITVKDLQKLDVESDVRFILPHNIRGQSFGRLATVISAPDTTHIVVDCLDHMHVGMYFDTYTATSKNGNSSVITAIDDATNTVTFTGAITSVAGDSVVLEDSYGICMNGLMDGIQEYFTDANSTPVNSRTCGNYVVYQSVDTYAGVARSTTPNHEWDATVYHPGGNGAVNDFDPKWISTICGKFQRRHQRKPGWNSVLADSMCLVDVVDKIGVKLTTMRSQTEKDVTLQSGDVIINNSLLKSPIKVTSVPTFIRHSMVFLDTGKMPGPNNDDAIGLRMTVEPNWVDAGSNAIDGVFASNVLNDNSGGSGQHNYTGVFTGMGNMVIYPPAQGLLCGINQQ